MSSRLRRVAVLTGSKSDYRQCPRGMNALRRAHKRGKIDLRMVRVGSVHRNPQRIHVIAQWLINEGIDFVVAGAGASNHLTGMLDALLRNVYHDTHTVVIGVAFSGKTKRATEEAIYSITGVPGFQGIFDEKRHVGSDGFYNACLDAINALKPEIKLLAPKPGEDFTIDEAYIEACNSSIPEHARYIALVNELEAAGLWHEYTGKVRETFSYEEFPDLLYFYQTDRISIFDIVLNTRIPKKGQVLTAMTVSFLTTTLKDMPNHLVAYGSGIDKYLPESLRGRPDLHKHMMVVKKTEPLKVEAIVRGYLTGTGRKDYLANGGIVCGIQLPEGLKDGSELPEPIFTPSTKAELGEHDVNISFDEAVKLIGAEMAEKIREMTLEAYRRVREELAPLGITIADTKLEFGIDKDGNLIIIDETFTPDSSRFWPEEGRLAAIQEGTTPPSKDKQTIRNWGEAAGIKKDPTLIPPQEVIDPAIENYLDMAEIKFGKSLEAFQADEMKIAA